MIDSHRPLASVQSRPHLPAAFRNRQRLPPHDRRVRALTNRGRTPPHRPRPRIAVVRRDGGVRDVAFAFANADVIARASRRRHPVGHTTAAVPVQLVQVGEAERAVGGRASVRLAGCGVRLGDGDSVRLAQAAVADPKAVRFGWRRWRLVRRRRQRHSRRCTAAAVRQRGQMQLQRRAATAHRRRQRTTTARTATHFRRCGSVDAATGALHLGVGQARQQHTALGQTEATRQLTSCGSLCAVTMRPTALVTPMGGGRVALDVTDDALEVRRRRRRTTRLLMAAATLMAGVIASVVGRRLVVGALRMMTMLAMAMAAMVPMMMVTTVAARMVVVRRRRRWQMLDGDQQRLNDRW